MTTCYPITRPVRVAEPTFAQEPVSIDDAKRACNISLAVHEDNEIIRGFIIAARQQFEIDAAIACYTGSFTWKLTEFPFSDVLPLPDLRPVTAITSIVYTDTSGASTTLSSSYYTLHATALSPYVGLNYGNVWPMSRYDLEGITVTYVCGYASVAAMPQALKQAVLMAVKANWLEKLEMFKEAQDCWKAYGNQVQRLKRETYS